MILHRAPRKSNPKTDELYNKSLSRQSMKMIKGRKRSHPKHLPPSESSHPRLPVSQPSSVIVQATIVNEKTASGSRLKRLMLLSNCQTLRMTIRLIII